MHYGAWGTAILSPVVLMMPPRRVGFQAIVLATGTFAAVNLLVYDYTGTTLMGRYRERFSAAKSATTTAVTTQNDATSFLPEKAQRTQELLRLEALRREAALPEAERRKVQEAREKREAANRGFFSSLWMGDAKEGWKEERRRKEKEALEEGKGYGDLIVEQVKEVFTTSKKEGEERQDAESKNTDDKK